MAAEEFSGAFEHSIDAKGRVIIPSTFREALGEEFTIALSGDLAAIALYPIEKWQGIREQLSAIHLTDPAGMRYKRLVMSNTYAGNRMDTQGRVLLPQKLRHKLGLEKEITFIGMGEHIEIWDASAHHAEETASQDEVASLLKHMESQYMQGNTKG